MSIVSEILDFNQQFVQQKDYEAFLTDGFPNKKLVVITCMDTRLVELLPRAMNFRNGDIKLIKNAGAVVSHPFGSVMRSILIAVYNLDAEEIAVVGHHGCGIVGLNCEDVLERARKRGISDVVLDTLNHSGIDLPRWLAGYDRVEDAVTQSVATIKTHPLLPHTLPVHGMIMDSKTGALELIVDGYAAIESAK